MARGTAFRKYLEVVYAWQLRGEFTKYDQGRQGESRPIWYLYYITAKAISTKKVARERTEILAWEILRNCGPFVTRNSETVS
jgi:hypothetical protein